MNDNPTQKGSKMNALHHAVRFTPGQVGMAAGCYHELFATFEDEASFQKAMTILIGRHVSGDWGDIDAHDKRQNEDALKTGARLMSSYTVNGVEVWIITDAVFDNPTKRRTTTFLRPEDY